MKTIHAILTWSEVVALLIPLVFMYPVKNQPGYLKPVRIYVWTALLLNIAISLIFHYKRKWHFPQELMSNNFLYNANSVARMLLFALFFILLRQPFMQGIKKAIPVLFILFLAVNFLFFEDFFYYHSLSGRLHSLETCILLLYCLQYYFFILTQDQHEDRRPPSFWVVTGLCIYVVINFPIYLFYKAMIYEFRHFTISIWDVQNMSYVVFCCFLAKAFYEAKKTNNGKIPAIQAH